MEATKLTRQGFSFKPHLRTPPICRACKLEMQFQRSWPHILYWLDIYKCPKCGFVMEVKVNEKEATK